MHLKDEIARRAKRLLSISAMAHYGLEDAYYLYLRLGDYDLHWQDSSGITINQRGEVYATIFQMTSQGSYDAMKPQYLPALLVTLRRALVLDDLARV
jgi:hypothetical protein